MQACLRRRDRDGGVAARGEDEDGVQRPLQELLPGAVLLRNPVFAGAGGPDRFGQVAHGGDLEAVGKLAEIVEVHDLGDQAAPDDSNPQPARHLHPI